MSHMHWIEEGTGRPNDKDEVNNRETFEFVVYYESRNRELKKRCKNEDRYDERLKTEESTCLTCIGLHEELEHLKIKTRLISANLSNVMGEYVI
jgi:hypothetical protein